MVTQLAERTASPITVFRQTLTQPAFREQLKMALPSHISEDRFIRVALTVAQQSPDLLNPQKVDRQSLFGALMKAAQDGLLPDGREGAIVPYKGKAQWQPMVAGIMTKVRRSGEIANWEVAAVFEKDTFERLLGDDQRIYHKPFEEGDPGLVVGAYSIVTFKDGTKSRDYLPRWRIEKARAQAMAKDSLMWTKFYDEGAVKTVIKHHAKRLPMATDIEGVFERDESMQHVNAEREIAAEPTAPAPALSRLDAIEGQIEPTAEPEVIAEQTAEFQAEIIDEETGEITVEDDQPAQVAGDERPAEVTPQPTYNMAEEIGLDDHPGKAIADRIIAEINDPATNAVMDVGAILNRSALDMGAMLDEDAVRIEVAADKRRAEIRAAREAVPAK